MSQSEAQAPVRPIFRRFMEPSEGIFQPHWRRTLAKEDWEEYHKRVEAVQAREQERYREEFGDADERHESAAGDQVDGGGSRSLSPHTEL